MRFAEKVKAARIAANKTRKETAEGISRTVRTIKAWELGETEPDDRTRRRLEKFFGVPIGALSNDVGEVDQELAKFVKAVMGISDKKKRERTIEVVVAMTKLIESE